MADFSIKEQKLAAARKKLRKFQKKKADVLPGLSRSGQSSPLDMLSSAQETLSSASSTTDISDIGSNKNGNYGQIDLLMPNDNSMSQQEPSEKNENQEMKNLIRNNIPASSQSVPYQFQNENSQTVSSHLFNSKSSELYQHTGVSEINRENLLSDRNKIATSNISANLFETSYESPDNEGSLCSETDASLTTVIQRKTDGSSVYPSQDTSLKSTTESLRQLSLQISGLVNDADIHDPSRHELTIIELEKRNNELASMFENEKQKSLEYTSLIEELKRTIESQTIQIQGFQKMSITESNGTEVNGLREQLQVHIQTIGILVAEKSELQTSLSHTRYSLEQKSGEVMDMQGRLEASRQHIKAIETSNQELRNQFTKLTESKESDSQQLSNLQTSHSKLSKLCDEMRATTAELTERLAIRTEENKKLNAEITEVRRDYELAQVHIEQLRNNSTEDLRKQFDDLQKGYSESLHQISLSRATLEQAEKEKQQMEQEYKSYASQLASDLEDIKVKLINESKKCEVLETKKEELQAELKVKESDQQLGTLLDAVTHEKNKLVKEVIDATESKKELEEKCSSLVRDNGQLSQYLSEINAKYEALEAAVDRNNTYQVDTSQLLQSMQSDKIAASRALSQNKQLKEQLEELQNGFVMMSNKKLELTEKLERELHTKKGLLKEIAQLGEELGTFKQDLLSKQREIENLKGKKVLSGTISDNQTEHSVNGLHHHHEDECEHNHHEHSHDEHDHHHEEGCEHDRHTAHEFPMNNSKENGVQNHSDDQESSYKKLNNENERKRTAENNVYKLVVTEESEDSNRALRMAHNALELKFLKCMEKLALLSDEKQELEHLVQQLQLETETVGDYITIYQFQRGVMKQKMQELTLELDLLRTEKQDMSTKLSQLQKLIEELSKNKNFSKEGLMKGVNSIMNEASTDTIDANSEDIGSKKDDTSAEKQDPTTTTMQESSQERSKNETVKQIMELLSEMESTSQLDISTFNRVHPCSHCSGKLITI